MSSEWGGRRKKTGDKWSYSSFVLIVASYLPDAEVEQGGGGANVFEPTLPIKNMRTDKSCCVAVRGGSLTMERDLKVRVPHDLPIRKITRR